MFPGIYDFHWDAGHIIFLGIFYTVLAVVLTTMVIALRRGVRDFRSHRAEALRWHADFEDLPASARRCRHELTGETPSRECPNGFDCRRCQEHLRFVAARGGADLPFDEPRIGGLSVPADRLYHRGHTWVHQEDDGTLTIGLDDLGARLVGKADAVVLPEPGARVTTNGVGWEVRRNGIPVRILAPVDGEVVALGGPDDRWVLRVRPDEQPPDTRHLLTPAEAAPWLLREFDRLQSAIAPEPVGAALADGGVPLDDLTPAIPKDRIDDVYGMVFLHP